MRIILFAIILLLISTVTFARMYQWVDPDTKTTQLSGKPPYWYRSGETGPRVIVFDNGRVIDDTGIQLSETEEDRIRQEALIIVEQDRQEALEKLMQANRQKAALDPQIEDDEAPEEIKFDVRLEEEEVDDGGQQEDENSEEQIEERMRALIEEYESIRTQNARELVETVNQ